MGEQHDLRCMLLPVFPKKRRLRPQNGFGSSGPKKLLKIVNCVKIEKNERSNGGGPSGIGGWPPISTWISSTIQVSTPRGGSSSTFRMAGHDPTIRLSQF